MSTPLLDETPDPDPDLAIKARGVITRIEAGIGSNFGMPQPVVLKLEVTINQVPPEVFDDLQIKSRLHSVQRNRPCIIVIMPEDNTEL